MYAIDPGSTASGWCIFCPNVRVVVESGHDDNLTIAKRITEGREVRSTAPTIAIEGMQNMGMEIGQSTLDAAVWIGRFIERAGGLATERPSALGAVLIYRRDVKLAICGNSRAKDKNIRQSMIDSFGGDDLAIGGTKCPACKGKGWCGRGRPTCPACNGAKWVHPPGPLHGVAGHAWSALAVALTYTRNFGVIVAAEG